MAAEFERLIPVDDDDDDRDDRVPARTTPSVSRASSSFSRASLARFSRRLRRRGWTVAADDDKENDFGAAADKRVKFDKRVYHGPVYDRSRAGEPGRGTVRGILKTSSRDRARRLAVPDRMRMYDVPVTSFYIGAGEHLTLPVKRQCPLTLAATREPKKTRRFGTDIGSYVAYYHRTT